MKDAAKRHAAYIHCGTAYGSMDVFRQSRGGIVHRSALSGSVTYIYGVPGQSGEMGVFGQSRMPAGLFSVAQ